MGLVTEEVRAKAEKYTGDEICREKTKVFLKEISMPNGLLPLKDIEEVKPALPVLRQLIYLNDEEVLTDACWALSYLSDGPNDKIQAVIQAGVCPLLVELLSHPSPTVLIPALRTVGNIVTGDDSQTLFIIDSGASEANLDRKRAAKAAADRKRAADKKKKDKKFNAAVKERKKNTLYEKTLRMLGIKK
uniref:IBB domain-containing protein n=1 Tax=Brassica oleracea var. oleracea TaxID=109376 RepID=A0A0D3DNL6_BRAOL